MAASQIARTFGALEQLCAHPAGLPLQTLAETLQVPKSAAHRALTELVALGYVVQNKATGQYLLSTRLLSLAFLAGSAIAIMTTGFLPRWLARAAVVAAVVQACFVPSMYFAPNPSDFYGAVGWGATALAPSFLVAWILLASLTLVRGGVRHPSKNSTAKPPAPARNSSAQ